MTTKDKIKSRVRQGIQDLQRKLDALENIPGLDKLDLEASFYATQIDFDRLSHEDVIKVISAIGGKWNKTPSDNAKVDYTTTVGGTIIRLWQGEPPPNCKIVEVLEEIPAQPARTITVRKLVCV